MRLVDIEKIQNKCLNLTICDGYEKNYINAMYKIMKNAPTVNAKKVVYAHWIGKPIAGYSKVKCSNCQNVIFENNGKYKFCPNCGATMERSDINAG